MKQINNFTKLVIFLIFLHGCVGYEPIFSSTKLQFKISNYSVEGDKILGNKIYSKLHNLSESKKVNQNTKNFSLFINVSKDKSATSKNSAGNRNYRKSDIDLINHIKSLLYDRRYTIKGAKQYLKDKGKEPSENNEQRTRQIRDIREKVIKLTAADLKTLKRIKSGLNDLLHLIDELK